VRLTLQYNDVRHYTRVNLTLQYSDTPLTIELDQPPPLLAVSDSHCRLLLTKSTPEAHKAKHRAGTGHSEQENVSKVLGVETPCLVQGASGKECPVNKKRKGVARGVRGVGREEGGGDTHLTAEALDGLPSEEGPQGTGTGGRARGGEGGGNT